MAKKKTRVKKDVCHRCAEDLEITLEANITKESKVSSKHCPGCGHLYEDVGLISVKKWKGD